MATYYNIEITRRFFRFLKDNDMFTRYAFNSITPQALNKGWAFGVHILTSPHVYLIKPRIQCLINQCFEWAKTKEGHDKWLELNNKWLKYIIEENLKD